MLGAGAHAESQLEMLRQLDTLAKGLALWAIRCLTGPPPLSMAFGLPSPAYGPCPPFSSLQSSAEMS